MNKWTFVGWGIALFAIGLLAGSIPTTEQQNYEQAVKQYTTDIYTLSNQYAQVYTLCEQKYNYALNGDIGSALRLNGQMDIILQRINQIIEKYNSFEL